MEKVINSVKSSKHSHKKSSKKVPTFIWVVLGIIFMAGFGYATTVNERGFFGQPGQIVNVSNVYFGNSSGLSNEAPTRALVSTTNKTIRVCSSGCDFTTIQDALNTVPLILRHKYNIVIHNGIYNENIWVPPTILGDVIDSTEGSVVALRISGNSSNYTGVLVNSFHLSGNQGYGSPTIGELTVFGTDPYSDENVTFAIYGSSHPTIKNIIFTNSQGILAKGGILSYSSSLTVSNVTFGDNILDFGAVVKHGGQIYSLDGGVNGTLISNVYKLQGGFIVTKNDTVSAGSGLVQNTKNLPTTGFLFSEDGGTGIRTFYNVNNLINLNVTTSNNNGGFGVLSNLSQTLFYVSGTNGTINVMPLGGTTTNSFIDFNARRALVGFNASTGNANLRAGTGRAVDLSAGNNADYHFDQVGFMRLPSNSSAITCNAGNAGSIYYDGSLTKHYGCNSTTWNALY